MLANDFVTGFRLFCSVSKREPDGRCGPGMICPDCRSTRAFPTLWMGLRRQGKALRCTPSRNINGRRGGGLGGVNRRTSRCGGLGGALDRIDTCNRSLRGSGKCNGEGGAVLAERWRANGQRQSVRVVAGWVTGYERGDLRFHRHGWTRVQRLPRCHKDGAIIAVTVEVM